MTAVSNDNTQWQRRRAGSWCRRARGRQLRVEVVSKQPERWSWQVLSAVIKGALVAQGEASTRQAACDAADARERQIPL